MANYTNEYSKLPHQIMDRHNFKDVDNSVALLVNQIKTLQAQGKYDKVNSIIKSNKENLKQYCLSAEHFNALDEETRNLEILTKSKKQSIYYSEDIEPDVVSVSDVWIS